MNIFIIVHIEGGAGKVVMSTALIEGIKKKYPKRKIITVSGYPEMFFNNPNVYRSFRFNETQYFFEDYIKKDTIVYKHNPYNTNEYIHGEEHLIPISMSNWHEYTPKVVFIYPVIVELLHFVILI